MEISCTDGINVLLMITASPDIWQAYGEHWDAKRLDAEYPVDGNVIVSFPLGESDVKLNDILI